MNERTVPDERVETTGSQTAPAQAVDEPSPGAQSETSADAAGLATSTDRPPALPVASETSAPALDADWRCKCGRPSTIWPGEYCDAHHVIPGTSGPAVTTGLDAEHLPEAEDVSPREYTDRVKVLDRERFTFYPQGKGDERWYDVGVKPSLEVFLASVPALKKAVASPTGFEPVSILRLLRPGD